MELVLERAYYAEGTNGNLLHDGVVWCHTIELPWKNNQHGVSCIPEGRYVLRKRYSRKFGWHLLVVAVPERDLILLHPANDALKELKGCIAPVTTLSGEGKGNASRAAFNKVKALVYAALERKEEVVLIVGREKPF